MCGFNSAVTIELVTPDDIKQIEQFGKNVLDELGCETISVNVKECLLGSYATRPQNFKILIGDRKLIETVIKHTTEKIKQYGYVYFAKVEDNNLDINSENTISLENGKHIFCSCTSTESKRIDLRNGPNNSQIVNQAGNIESRRDLSNDHCLISLLDIKIKERLNIIEKTVNESNSSSIGVSNSRYMSTFNYLWNNLKKYNISILREGEQIHAKIQCFCGTQSKNTFIQNKNDWGHWKLFTFERHLNSHLNTFNKQTSNTLTSIEPEGSASMSGNDTNLGIVLTFLQMFLLNTHRGYLIRNLSVSIVLYCRFSWIICLGITKRKT